MSDLEIATMYERLDDEVTSKMREANMLLCKPIPNSPDYEQEWMLWAIPFPVSDNGTL